MDNGQKKKYPSRRKRLNIDSVSRSSEVAASTAAEVENAGTDNPKSADEHENESAQQPAPSTSQPPGASSPDPNCAICLSKLENKSFTDSCFHTFCFVCLVEWSKVKAECPLCKQSFKSIVHNVRSYDDYDQYHVQRPEEQNPLYHMRPLMEEVRFRYRTTVTDHRYAHIAERIDQEIQNRLLQRPSHRHPVPNWRRMRQPANSDFRRSVYQQRLKQTAQMNTRRRVRETSPTFFRDNQAQTHRLVPWLNRELNALLHGHGEQIAFVLDLIMGLIKRHAIDSEEFYQHVYPFIGRHTRQFMQEFLIFAKSPYHMAAYDRHVTYEPSEGRHHDSDSDSDHNLPVVGDDDNDSDVVVVSPDNSPLSGSRHLPTAAPPRADASLDPWERSIMTVGNPTYLGFAPIMRTFGHEDLSHGLDNNRNPYHRLDLPPSASGWDSPTPGPSNIFDDLIMTTGGNIIPPPSSLVGTNSSIWTPSASSYSAPITPLQSRQTDSVDNFLNLMHRAQLPTSVASNTQGNPIVCNESDSNSDEVMIVDYEKPWNDRSPIQLSSAAEDTDSDLVFTGMSYANNPVKKEKKKKHKHRSKRDTEKENDGDSLKKRHADVTSPGSSKPKKRRRHTRSRSISTPRVYQRERSRSGSSLSSHQLNHSNRSRSRSHSPIKMRLYKSPSYRHKKFGYTTQKKRDKDQRRHHSRKSFSSTASGSRNSYRGKSSSSTLTDSDGGSESRHVSYTSRKHRDNSRQASIEILQYRKKSSKHKKSKKHKKEKKRETTELSQKHPVSDEEHQERTKRLQSDTLKPHKHKHSKAKKKKSKHRSHKHKERAPFSQCESENEQNQNMTGSPKDPIDDDSDPARMPTDVSKQVAKIFKEIAEIKQRRAHEISEFTSDSSTDSEIDVENLTDNDHRPRRTDNNTCNAEKVVVNSDVDILDEKEVHDNQTINTDDTLMVPEVNKTADTLEMGPSDDACLNSAVFHTSGVEFVELPLDETALVDLELASITKSLTNQVGEDIRDASLPRQFKKHPFGHKKSSKPTNDTVSSLPGNNVDHIFDNASSVLEGRSSNNKYNHMMDDNIQFNDVSSCTDLDTILSNELPSERESKFHDRNWTLQNSLNSDGELKCDRSSALEGNSSKQESPSNSECLPTDAPPAKHSLKRENLSDFVNVETLSDGSDVDIVGENFKDSYKDVPSSRTSKASLKLTDSGSSSDVTATSYEKGTSRPEKQQEENNEDIQDEIDVTGLSDTDSLVEFVGEEHEEIDITEDTDSERESDVEVMNNDSDHYIDVLGNSDDEIVIGDGDVEDCRAVTSEKLTVDIESDSTDLDYHCDESDEDEHNSVLENQQKISRSGKLSVDKRLESDGKVDISGDEYSNDASNEKLDEKMSRKSNAKETSSENTSTSNESFTLCSASALSKCDNDYMEQPVRLIESDDSIAISSSTTASDTLVTNSIFLHKDTMSTSSLPVMSTSATSNCIEHFPQFSKLQDVLDEEQSDLYDSNTNAITGDADFEIRNTVNAADMAADIIPPEEKLELVSPKINVGNADLDSTCNRQEDDEMNMAQLDVQETSTATSNAGNSSFSWTANPLFEPRNTSFFLNNYNSELALTTSRHDSPQYMSTTYEPRSPLFQLSPEYGQPSSRSPLYSPFSPAASDLSEENFVAED